MLDVKEKYNAYKNVVIKSAKEFKFNTVECSMMLSGYLSCLRNLEFITSKEYDELFHESIKEIKNILS